MLMYHYIDKSYAVLDHTILMCGSKKENDCVIPGNFPGAPKELVLGAGAVPFSRKGGIRHLTISEGIVRSNDPDLWENGLIWLELPASLREAAMPDPYKGEWLPANVVIRRRISADMFRRLRRLCASIGEGHQLLTAQALYVPGLELLKAMAEGNLLIAPNVSGQTALFFGGGQQNVLLPTELKALREMREHGESGWSSALAERKNDELLRDGRSKYESVPSRYTASWRVGEETEHDGEVTLQIFLKKGRWHTLRMVPVMADGAEYHLCFRNWLGAKDMEYFREFCGVMLGDNLVKDTRIVELAYGKFKLLSLL